MNPVLQTLGPYIRPPAKPGVLEWARQLIIPPSMSPDEAGPFSVSTRPYMARRLEEWKGWSENQDGERWTVNSQTMCWGTRCGKTTVPTIGLGYRVDIDPQPALWVNPNTKLVHSFSQTRWQPFIKANPCLARHMPLDTDLFKIDEQHFDRMVVNMVGAGSATNLSDRTVVLLVQNEVCKFERVGSSEASAMQLADHRVKGIAHHFNSKCSTPTVPENEFWQDYLLGTQEEYMGPCPNCTAALRFEHHDRSRLSLAWDKDAKTAEGTWNLNRVKETAHYLCPACGFAIRDQHKPAIARAGQWIVGNPNAPRNTTSSLLPSFWSPNVSFGDMAVTFLKGLDSLLGLHDYFNGWLARPWEQQLVNIKESSILGCRDVTFRLKTIPFTHADLLFVVITADPGDHATHWCVTAFSKSGRMCVIDYGTVLAPEDLQRIHPELRYPTTDGHLIGPRVGLIDSGDQTHRIYDLCLASRGLFLPTKGSNARFGTWSSVTPRSHPGILLYTYVDFTLKCDLYIDGFEKHLPPTISLPADIGHDFIQGCSGQQMLERRLPTGTMRYWKPLPQDHYGDCLKLARLAFRILADPSPPNDKIQP